MNVEVASVVEGETARIVWPLIEDGAALDGTGLTVADLQIKDRNGVPVDTTSDFGWSDQSSGTVYYDPDAADFVAAKGPYRVRVKLTDGSNKIRYYPNRKQVIAEINVEPV